MTIASSESITKHWDCVPAAAAEVFQSLCGVDLVVSADQNPLAEDLILAVISLVGDLEWSLFLGLPAATATTVAAKFAGFEIPFDSPDLGDAIGEVANILAGRVKALLDSHGVRADISLPTVLRAKGLEVLIQRQTVSQKICLQCDMGRLWVGVAAGRGSGMMP